MPIIDSLSQSDRAIMEEIGRRFRRERLNQNKTQAEVSSEAGVSLKTVKNVEYGKGGSLSTIIAILRALGRLHELERFMPEPGLSPIELSKLHGKVRMRATGTRGSLDGDALEVKEEWTWGSN